jgi:hypothetical protein
MPPAKTWSSKTISAEPSVEETMLLPLPVVVMLVTLSFVAIPTEARVGPYPELELVFRSDLLLLFTFELERLMIDESKSGALSVTYVAEEVELWVLAVVSG